MSDTKDNSESAFPLLIPPNEQWSEFDRGMTLRDYFAAKAMASLLVDASAVFVGPDHVRSDGRTISQVVAARAYAFADAMIDTRSK